ncbi:hypothetical protein F383_01642 [Gossypium arboreum]|uniref:Uncharacterized protein n=1 Tax=Gossypium arboreum TaxID=29729 RepID=A0A0B0PCR5_GOSAR|nr:hypothetical protein F383_01642 [Gossypium arboreum]
MTLHTVEVIYRTHQLLVLYLFELNFYLHQSIRVTHT